MHMVTLLKSKLRKMSVFKPIFKWVILVRRWKHYLEWKKEGKPIPPPHVVKQYIIHTYQIKYKLKVLVETGTCYGDMVEAMKDFFDYIYSIELSKDLYEQTKERFKADKHIELIQGDSGIELGKVVSKINRPALFWLDGHYSGGVTARGDKVTPIYEELNRIYNSQDRGHVIIIDDARLFGTDPAYPRIDEIIDFIKTKGAKVTTIVKEDSIRVLPKR